MDYVIVTVCYISIAVCFLFGMALVLRVNLFLSLDVCIEIPP